MNNRQLEFLRDAAIANIPRATALRDSTSKLGASKDDFYRTLTHVALSVMAKATSSAVEYAAAELLDIVVAFLAVDMKHADSKDVISRISEAANTLYALVGGRPDWLDGVVSDTAVADLKAATVREPPKTHLTTEEAAKALNHAPQTLYKWSSEQNGPISPIKVGRKIMWLCSDIEKMLNPTN